MPKRKNDDEPVSGGGSDSEDSLNNTKPQPKVKKAKITQEKTAKATKEIKTKRKSKGGDSGAGSEPVIGKVATNAEGDKFLSLDEKGRRVTVRQFNATTLIDLREYYHDQKDGGALKPGKKGISLTVEQWKSLTDSIGAVDKLIAEME